MEPNYKATRAVKAFCPICEKKLIGNNSIMTPWECDCGIWKFNITTNTFEIIKKLIK